MFQKIFVDYEYFGGLDVANLLINGKWIKKKNYSNLFCKWKNSLPLLQKDLDFASLSSGFSDSLLELQDGALEYWFCSSTIGENRECNDLMYEIEKLVFYKMENKSQIVTKFIVTKLRFYCTSSLSLNRASTAPSAAAL